MSRACVLGYDVVRGFSVISMIGFHLCYDLAYLRGVSLPWFAAPLQDFWRASISWTFLLLAGIMCSYSRNILRRAALYLGVAAMIYVVTVEVSVDTPISFGIIYVMGFSTLLAWLLGAIRLMPKNSKRALLLSLCLLSAFILCLGVPTGSFGLKPFGGPYLATPRELYTVGWLSWLGFPGGGFASGDYYPPLPFTLLYLSGACLGVAIKRHGCPTWFAKLNCRPLAFVGRHALELYVIHQPLLLALTGVL